MKKYKIAVAGTDYVGLVPLSHYSKIKYMMY